MKKIAFLMFAALLCVYIVGGCSQSNEPAGNASTNAPTGTNAPAK
jgi:hypothetical protein